MNKPREYYFSKEKLPMYSDTQEPNRYPDLYVTLIKKDDYDQLAKERDELKKDLRMCREIGIEQQRAVNDRQFEKFQSLLSDAKNIVMQSNKFINWAPDDGFHFEDCLSTVDEENLCDCGYADRANAIITAANDFYNKWGKDSPPVVQSEKVGDE